MIPANSTNIHVPVPTNAVYVQTDATPSDLEFDDSTTTLSPDSLMAYCQSRLGSIDDQARTLFKQQQMNENDMVQIESVASLFKNYSSADQKDPKIIADMATQLQEAIFNIQGSDPHSSALPKLIQTYNDLVWSTTGDPSGGAGAAAKGPPFIEPQTYPPDKSTPPDMDLSSTEIQGFAQNLSDASSNLNSESELQMIQLQSLMSQRQTAVSLTTNLVQSLGDETSKIAENIGH